MRRAQHSRILSCLGFSMIGMGTACVDQELEELGVSEEEIVGGTNTTIAANPWQIALTSVSGSQFCGGSILNASWVLAAQHSAYSGASLTAAVITP
jgi:secreted trypsin-like serine protease